MNRGLVGVLLVLGIGTGLVSACSGSSSGSADGAAMAPAEAAGAGNADGPKATDEGAKSGAAGKQDVSQPGVDRMLVRTATVELTATDVGDTVDRARDIAATEGGYAGGEEVRQDAATLTLRIPADRFDKALGELSGLGNVISRDQSAEDVTEQVVDLNSRITTQRASVDRVRALLARAATVEEIVRIEGELTSREADLESLEQRQQALSGQVAMSTVTIRVSRTDAVPAPPRAESSGFLAGLSDGWGAFLDAGAGTLRVLGAMLPFLLALGVPAALVLRWWRRRRTAAVVQQP
jgi:hypothetical protein